MARDINKRLTQLSSRRKGLDRIDKINETQAFDELVRKGTIAERWEKRAASKPNTRYALGAMQAVDPDYTRISVETAGRVANQLEQGLIRKGTNVQFRLQGSVPLDVHIRGVSDVDLLTLTTDFFTYATYGARARAGGYVNPSSKSALTVLAELRAQCEVILAEAFPKAELDKTGGKAIAISGGSLARPVDVVPSHWFDTVDFQASGDEASRAVTILDKKVPTTLDNWPFLHIRNVDLVDSAVYGALKKAIRLCKNVKADAKADGTDVTLPSFDITSAMYHADRQALTGGRLFELAILAETQRHLDHLARNIDYAKTLKVPDGSRAIFNTDDKIRGLIALSIEVDDLLREVAKEQNGYLATLAEPALDVSRGVLKNLDASGL
ncbi:hypothetical protein [Rhizobium leguminosarum]|uniref:hypothetical protein n=1 Tax=Rhizobium leguminosarum TaxID=384 RepID=UPI00036943F0|nr:hypothetical protein [Rhizobium leguminosarum]